MLRVSIIGNLGGDPEVRYTQKGEQIVTVSVAVNQRRRLPDSDEWKESTHWIRVRCTGWRADEAQKLAKGARVYVNGRMEINDYQRRDGSTGWSYDVWADELHSMSGRADSGSPNGSSQPRPSGVPLSAPTGALENADLEDLPF